MQRAAARPTVIRLTSYHRYIHRPHGIPIAHARNVNVGTGIGKPGTVESRASSGEKGREATRWLLALTIRSAACSPLPSLWFNPSASLLSPISSDFSQLRCEARVEATLLVLSERFLRFFFNRLTATRRSFGPKSACFSVSLV